MVQQVTLGEESVQPPLRMVILGTSHTPWATPGRKRSQDVLEPDEPSNPLQLAIIKPESGLESMGEALRTARGVMSLAV